MKKKIFAVGLVVALLVGGLILASCDESCSAHGYCEAEYSYTSGGSGWSISDKCDDSDCAVNKINSDTDKDSKIKCDC
jgi:hypothetical protein